MTIYSSRLKMGRALLALMLALVAVVSCSGCSYKVPGVKNYPLSERRTAVMEHLKDKYGEEFAEIMVNPTSILESGDTFYLYPKKGTKDDEFVARCVMTKEGLSISDGYFGVLIRDEYEKVMNDIVGEACDEFFLSVSTQIEATWNDRYNRDTKISDLYRKGEYKSYQSLIQLHLKELPLASNQIENILQSIAKVMLDRKLKGIIWADIIKDDKYDELKGKTSNEIQDITHKNLRDFFVYPSDKISPTYTVSIFEDASSGTLVIKYLAE